MPQPGTTDPVEACIDRLGLTPVLALEKDMPDVTARLAAVGEAQRQEDYVGVALGLWPLHEQWPEDDAHLQFISACCLVGWVDAARQQLPEGEDADVILQVADALLRRGRRQATLALLQQLQDATLTASQRRQAVRMHLQARQPALALTLMEKAGSEPSVEDELLTAQCLWQLGRDDEAYLLLQSLHDRFPDDGRVAFWLGRTELRMSAPEVAAAGRQRLTDLATEDTSAVVAAFEAGRAWLAAGKYQQALNLLDHARRADYQTTLCEQLEEQALRKLGREKEALFTAAQRAIDLGDFPGAEKLLQQCLQAGVERMPVLRRLAEVQYWQNKQEAAEKTLREALSLTPNSASCLRLLARVQNVTGEDEKARQLLSEKAPELKQDGVALWTDLAEFEFTSNLFDQAEQHLLQALAVDDTDINALYQLGVVYSARYKSADNTQRALEQFVRALEVDRTHPDSWFQAGLMLERLERHAAAAACLRRAVGLNVLWESAYLPLARELGRLGRSAERDFVTAEYRRLRSSPAHAYHSPNDLRMKWPLTAAMQLGKSRVYWARAQPYAAFRELTLGLTIAPRDADLLRGYADACAVLGYTDLQREAERRLREVEGEAAPA